MAINGGYHMSFATLGIIASSRKKPVASGKVVKINCTQAGDDALEPDWNNAYMVNSVEQTLALNTDTGAVSGWSFVYYFGGGGCESLFNPVVGDPDFPDDVINMQWFSGDPSLPMTMNLIGLDPAKTYNILTYSMDNSGGDGLTSLTFGGTTLTGDPSSYNPVKLLFSAIAPDGAGQISGAMQQVDGSFPVINGIIITEN
jgi:hypothetical protein